MYIPIFDTSVVLARPCSQPVFEITDEDVAGLLHGNFHIENPPADDLVVENSLTWFFGASLDDARHCGGRLRSWFVLSVKGEEDPHLIYVNTITTCG